MPRHGATPAISRKSKAHRPIPRRRIQALQSLETAAGGRLSLVDQLHTNTDPDIESLAASLADPTNDARTLARILEISNISVGKFLGMLSQAKLAKATLDAMDRVAKYLPEVAADVMARSVPHTTACTVCNGTGVQQMRDSDDPLGVLERPCIACHSSGQVNAIPDLDRQKVALELGGMLHKGGPQVAVQVNTGPAVTSPHMRDQASKMLYDKPEAEPIEAEVEEEPVDAEVVEKKDA